MARVRPRAAAVLIGLVTTQAMLLPRANEEARATTVVRCPEGRGFRLGDIAFFTACGAREGCELWKTDGTAAGTRLVKDIVPGEDGSGPNRLTPAGDRLYFTAWDATHGRELWRTDGTETGTVVLDLVRGTRPSYPSELTPAGPTLYFLAEHPEAGEELWKSDGTPAGTALVSDIHPGPDGSNPSEPVVEHESVYFFAFDGRRHGIWKADANEAAFVSAVPESAFYLTALPRAVVFVAADEKDVIRLWAAAEGHPAVPVTEGLLAGSR